MKHNRAFYASRMVYTSVLFKLERWPKSNNSMKKQTLDITLNAVLRIPATAQYKLVAVPDSRGFVANFLLNVKYIFQA